MQLIPNHILEIFGLHHSIEGAFLLRYTNFRSVGSFLSQERKNHLSSCLKMSVERSSSFSSGKTSMQLRSVRNWIGSRRTMVRPTAPSPSGLLNSKNQNEASKIHLERAVHPPLPLMKIFKP